MTFTYNPWLVSLSIVVAVLVSFTSLNLASRVADSGKSASRAWLILGGIAMGIGIWSMHFIGMLAFSVPIQLRYGVGLTLLSLGVAIVTSGFAIQIASRASLGHTRHLFCSLLMGLGIVTMHYIGMSAIPVVPAISYDPLLVAASVAIAVTASYAALWLTFNLRSATHRHLWPARFGAAVIMGLAISGMHYCGMAAAKFRPGAFCRSGVALDPQWLAISIGIATLALLFVILITGIFDAHFESRARLHRQRLQMANSRLNHQATHDALTKLPNRSAFLNQLQSAIDKSMSGASEMPLLAVMLVDLDRFKVVNDSLGHEFGDAVLEEVASRLLKIVGDRGVAARMGGDEFLVMLRAVDTQSIIRTADRIVECLREIYKVRSVELHLAASVGITTYPFDNCVPYVLLSHADEAMYEAKNRGGNGFQFFVPGTTVFTMQRLELENDLRNAAALGQMELHYQPQVDISSGRIMGLEALARWKHPVHGWVAPGEFIPLAESSDLIVHIGKWILDEACRQAHVWHGEGFVDLSIAVNLSARQFRQPDLLSMIQQTVEKHGLRPAHIVIELTESVVMADADRATETLEQLHRSGFQVAVDDFGTGYSSMSYLKRLPVSKLKIDQSFIADLGASAKSDSIVKAVIALAHGLGMTVIAEGVETAAQLSFLRAFGCNQYQGYLYSRPRNAADIAEFLRSKPEPFEGYVNEELLLGSAV
jgi:diguanylate cyclase (GGDEF)-like protein